VLVPHLVRRGVPLGRARPSSQACAR